MSIQEQRELPQPPPDNPVDESPVGEGYQAAWIKDYHCRVATQAERADRLCRRPGCRRAPDMALRRSNGWWLYCDWHCYGRRIVNGVVLHRVVVAKEPTIVVKTVRICELCLSGKEGECHSPGCAFWMCPAITVEQAERLRDRSFRGGRMMTDDELHGVMKRIRRARERGEMLTRELAFQRTLLTHALHELAVSKDERDPKRFIEEWTRARPSKEWQE